jgi:putative transcriptional regulator
MDRRRPAALALLLGLAISVSALAQPAAGRLLVAARGLIDPNFERSVVLLVEHGAEGSLGLVINRPTAVPLAQLFPDQKTLGKQGGFLHAGGPVSADRFLLLLRAPRPPEDCRQVFADVYVGWTPAALRDPGAFREFRLYAGYAGWAPGQLEAEMAHGDWRILPAEAPLIFHEHPEQLWEELTRRMDTPVASGR